MTSRSPIPTLNRLLVIHYRSLPTYLSYAAPSWHEGDELARQTMDLIAQDQRAIVDRLVELVTELNGNTDFGNFPMEFTCYHDLSFGFLLQKLIDSQRRDIEIIENCVRELDRYPLAKAVAEESLGAAKAHLESLQELKQPGGNLALAAH